MNIYSLMLLTNSAEEYLESVVVEDTPELIDYLFTSVGLIGLFALIILPIFLAIIPANIAKKKNRSFAGYYMFGYFALIPAIIVVNILKPVEKEEKPKRSISEKAGKR